MKKKEPVGDDKEAPPSDLVSALSTCTADSLEVSSSRCCNLHIL